MVLTFETIGPSFTGDILVASLDEQDDWAFHSSEYIATIDSYFDYKHERKDKLDNITQRRNARIRYHAGPQNALQIIPADRQKLRFCRPLNSDVEVVEKVTWMPNQSS